MEDQDVDRIWGEIVRCAFAGFPPCHTCGQPVAHDAGSLSVDYATTQDNPKETLAVHWHWGHDGCTQGRRFRVPARELVTPGLVLRQMDALQRRAWFWRSDWSGFVWSVYAPLRFPLRGARAAVGGLRGSQTPPTDPALHPGP